MSRMPLVVPIESTRFPAPPVGAMVLVAAELLLELVDRANPDVDLTVRWGEPEAVTARTLGLALYAPTFTRHEPQSGEPGESPNGELDENPAIPLQPINKEA